MGVGFKNSRRKQDFKPGGVGLSRKSEDQTKNPYINNQTDDKVNFFSFSVAFESTSPIFFRRSNKESSQQQTRSK
jgi:hypothetical protein